MPSAPVTLHRPLLAWYDEHARDLPWRSAAVVPEVGALRPPRRASPWSVMVSELMLQQTPVTRVLPVHQQWLARWPTPADLAAEPPGEAIRMWGRLGYPRRALRLHAAATVIAEQHGGEVPADVDTLRTLPGVGEYTAAAIAVFAFGRRHAVLDTNVRRVLGRLVGGTEYPPASLTRAERERATDLLPDDAADAATWSIAVMELGALVCTAARPRCVDCPIAAACAWRAAGYPAYDGPPRRGQAWAGTDRQCRGRLMAVVREADRPVGLDRLTRTWDEADQRTRCLAGLVEDGLLVRTSAGYALP